jgi:hypothetical protein
MRIALTLWLALLAAAAWGQTTSITIPLTVPPPVPITVTIPQGTKITANGVTYLVAGTSVSLRSSPSASCRRRFRSCGRRSSTT